MRKTMKKSRFKKCETGYHKPDITCSDNGLLTCLYEVIHKHPIDGHKLGLIEYWCYRNATEVTVFEVSADFILRQTEKPESIKFEECYIINPFDAPVGTVRPYEDLMFFESIHKKEKVPA